MALGTTVLRGSQQVARDDELLDLAGSVENAKGPGMAVQPLDDGAMQHAVATKELDGLVDYGASGLGCLPFGNCRSPRVVIGTTVVLPCRPVDEQRRCV